MEEQNKNLDLFKIPDSNNNSNRTLNLSPAKWIWYPSERCLQNTFVLFRKEFDLIDKPVSAKGWIIADSRYILYLNGMRVQFGPPPSDPRWMEADPIDLSALLDKGKNSIGAQVLFYGQGDGTWPLGKPGFLFNLEIIYPNGDKELIISDQGWLVHLAKSWKPGHYKRWYIRSLQEEFDARLFPYGWNKNDFEVNQDWLPALELDCPPDKPSICSSYSEYMLDILGDRQSTELRKRSIPILNEYFVPIEKLSESYYIKWKRPAEEYFDFLTPDSFEALRKPATKETEQCEWEVFPENLLTASLVFEFEEQIVGWPIFTIEASSGTTIELIVHEAHQTGGPPLLNSHFHSWTRFICKEGLNDFETFDYESCRWMQFLIRNSAGPVKIKNIGMRRRIYPWPNIPKIKCAEKDLQKLFNATINTLHNCAQETLVDGMARERQQYSGDCGHQLHAIFYTFGETKLPARYITTYSQGITLDGYFMDCWPGYDRLARLMERQMQLSCWGPILDHGVGFIFDCYNYYMYTGDLKTLKEPFPRLIRFFQYLTSIRGKDGLLPVENIGIPSVWIDHDAYEKQIHKQCAFNLYTAAMLENALAPLCRVFKETVLEQKCIHFSKALLKATIENFWSKRHGLFVNNLPWLRSEKSIRLCDRSLATSLIFNQCPNKNISASIKALSERPKEMGISFPANAGWRFWALAKYNRVDVILKEFREIWSNMDSVKLNNTLQEYWVVKPDSDSEWSHCPVAPLYISFMCIAGIKPLEPGFKKIEIRPQLGNLESLDLIANTIRGQIHFKFKGKQGDRELIFKIPANCRGELVINKDEDIDLKTISRTEEFGNARYLISSGKEIKLRLKYT